MLKRRVPAASMVLLAMLLSACSLFGPKTADLTGTVVFEKNSSPLADVEVVVGNKKGQTDENGRFTVKGLEHGNYTVEVRFEGFTIHRQAVKIAGSSQTIQLKIKPLLSGTVTFDTGEPAVGVRVKLYDDVVFTNEDGFYVFANVVEGTQQVSVLASSIEHSKQVTVSGAHTTGVDFVVPTPQNVALNKPVEASSVFTYQNTAYAAENAVDGVWDDYRSRWLTADKEPPPHWLVIDLQGVYGLHGGSIYTGDVPPRNPGPPLEAFKFQYWTGSDWADIPGGVLEGNSSHEVHFTFTDSIITDKVRFYTEQEPADVGGFTAIRILEILVYGLPLNS